MRYKTRRQTKKPVPKPVMSQLEAAINDSYSFDVLKRLYIHYLSSFFDENFFDVKGNFSVNKIKKAGLVSALAKVYSDEKLFHKLLSLMPRDVKEILNILVWEGGKHDSDEFEDKYQSKIVSCRDRYFSGSALQKVDSAYLLFCFDLKYRYEGHLGKSTTRFFLYLPDNFRRIFKRYVGPPEGYDLIPLDEIEKTHFVFEDNDQVIGQIKLFSGYIKQGNINFSKTGNILKNSLKQMAAYCGISEFYDGPEDKTLEYVRTKLIIDFFMKAEQNDFYKNSADSVKQLFDAFFNYRDFRKYESKDLLNYIKGRYYSYSKREMQIRKSLADLLKVFPISQWVSVENIIKYLFYREIRLEPADMNTAKNYLFYNAKYEGSYYPSTMSVRITEDIYKEALVIPFIKAAMFLFASFGILDLAYDLPENELLPGNGRKYLCVFDGLKYVRLTELGAYISGLTREYDVKIEEQEANIILDESRLIISLEGEDRLKQVCIEKFADKISSNCYRVDYNSFLKGCTSRYDIEQRTAILKDMVSSDLPGVWLDFLDEVSGKIEPLLPEKTMNVYKLKQNRELVSLFAKDEVLKEYVMKAENYHIVVDSKHVNKVKKRLEEFGYFIDEM
ncbi:MAG: hypothetical protein GY795_16825 [Desulfobacterales bacterium]|nr:hypothetical protein [Desulfobacterales bacterium]